MRENHALRGRSGPGAPSWNWRRDAAVTRMRGRLRHAPGLALNFFNVHAARLPETLETQKPTVGFLARFFWEGSNRRNSLSFKLLRGIKSQTIAKTRKKVSFFRAAPAVFLPNRPKKGRFSLSVRFLERGHDRF
jgi:hypothetical protein